MSPGFLREGYNGKHGIGSGCISRAQPQRVRNERTLGHWLGLGLGGRGCGLLVSRRLLPCAANLLCVQRPGYGSHGEASTTSAAHHERVGSSPNAKAIGSFTSHAMRENEGEKTIRNKAATFQQDLHIADLPPNAFTVDVSHVGLKTSAVLLAVSRGGGLLAYLRARSAWRRARR
jgi:hypothetical protein